MSELTHDDYVEAWGQDTLSTFINNYYVYLAAIGYPVVTSSRIRATITWFEEMESRYGVSDD